MLTFDSVMDYLESTGNEVYIPNNQNPSFARIVFFEEDVKQSSLVIIDAQDISAGLTGVLSHSESLVKGVLIAGRLSDTDLAVLQSTGIPFAIVQASICRLVILLLNFTQARLNRLEQTLNNDCLYLLQQLSDNSGLESIVDAVYSILGNPIIIHDPSYKVLAYRYPPEVHEPFWETVIANGCTPNEYVEIIRREGHQRKLDASQYPVFYTAEGIKLHYKNVGIRIMTSYKPAGYLTIMEYNRKLTEDDLQLIIIIAKVIAIELTKENAIERALGNLEQGFLKDLIEGKVTTEEVALNRAKTLNWIIGKMIKVLVIKDPQGQRIGGKYLQGVQETIAPICPGARVFTADSSILILISANKNAVLAHLRETIRDYCRQKGLIAGLSSTGGTLTDIENCHSQAQKAINIALCLGSSPGLYEYEKLAVYDILMGLPGDEYIPKALVRLQKMGGENFRLLETLETYFRCLFSISRTAAELGIHRNTVADRIDRLEELLECNLSDYDTCLRLQLGLKMLELSKSG